MWESALRTLLGHNHAKHQDSPSRVSWSSSTFRAASVVGMFCALPPGAARAEIRAQRWRAPRRPKTQVRTHGHQPACARDLSWPAWCLRESLMVCHGPARWLIWTRGFSLTAAVRYTCAAAATCWSTPTAASASVTLGWRGPGESGQSPVQGASPRI